ncbi:MAG TPA: hypothetical protein VF482_06545 [Trebonia sp.]
MPHLAAVASRGDELGEGELAERVRATARYLRRRHHVIGQPAGKHVPDEDSAATAAEFSPAEIAALLTVIVTINAWNRIAVTTRAWEPGSYQP